MTKLIFPFLISLFFSPACAFGVEPVEPIGRLFFSPSERASFDLLRKNNTENAATGSVAPLPSSQPITLNGVVKRSSGNNTVWINQQPQYSPPNLAIAGSAMASPTVSITLTSGKKINMKAGQTFDITKGKLLEGYEDADAPIQQEKAKQQ